MVQTDAMYKSYWQKYPALTGGTPDARHVFHPFVSAVCKDETAVDFEFMFRALHSHDLE